MRFARTARSHISRVALLLTVAAVSCSAVFLIGATAHATVTSPVDAGQLVVVDADNPSKVLTHGGSATKFSFRLPPGASCPGDSENDQWRVQSFLVPSTYDPGALRYGEIAPDGQGLWALYSLDTHAFVHILTLPNSQPGQPGIIDALPAFSFVLFPPGTLPDGTYRVGIACTYFRDTAKYWDTQFVLTRSSDDQPGQLEWRVAGASTATTTSGSRSSGIRWVFVGIGILAVAALTSIVWQRTARRTRPLLKEHS
jgi:hypothetical protein